MTKVIINNIIKIINNIIKIINNIIKYNFFIIIKIIFKREIIKENNILIITL